MKSIKHTNFVLGLTPTQRQILVETRKQTLGKAQTAALKQATVDPNISVVVTAPIYSHPEVTNETIQTRHGAALKNDLYAVLKSLAEKHEMPMAQVAIRLLQLPE